ncbi:hypothetical protein [Maridesulfovibrio salexigens]|uniref:Uncharacterized protein n=1 Tax=Maridesulfovibrio salexigens (strain ATCC 14822 / DSM 2638 / NCIMB 8403 / VKM B-1763) TaxID=526222 RepID=C6C235_MARSD|nr:hypothetical protein [Maridesulfovibrio salexigens]ACS81236.1 hypothetical protein Desal_3185 [Maridesulfovibrio salexigens DSM 2638]
MINSVQSAYATQSVDEVLQSRARTQPTSQERQSGDKVTISDSAKMLASIDSFFSDMNIPYTPGQSISLDDLKTGLETSTKKFQDDVNVLFLQNDISTDPPVELTTDGYGNVRVMGDHPQKDKIEQLFEDNPDLANDFRGISGLNSLVEAGEEYLEFAKAYEKNPYEAVAKYSHIFSGMDIEEFSMTVGGDNSVA